MKVVAGLLLGALAWGCGAGAWAEGSPAADLLWTPAQVADASDRAYEPTAIHLIDHAASSIALAMYAVQDSPDAGHPVNRLLQDLVEAARRGVQVEIYLNVVFAGRDDGVFAAPWVARLRNAGARVTPVSPGRRWHGKLLIVDERYILEGSANWSIAALKANGESNTVMDAPELARQKLAHLRGWGTRPPAPTRASVPTPIVPETFSIPAAWLAQGGLFSQCVTRGDQRGFDAAWVLLRRGAAEATSEFSLDLDAFGDELGLSHAWSRTHRRQEVLQVLRRLARRYGLITVRVNRRRDAWVRVTPPEGPSVTIPSIMTTPEVLARQSAAATYLLVLTETLPHTDGVEISTLTARALAARMGVTHKTLRRARRELERAEVLDD